MAAAQPRLLGLVVPGLMGPVPESVSGALGEVGPLRATEMLLARSRCLSTMVYDPSDVFSLDSASAKDLPAGPLGLLGAGGEPGQDYWFRADPVHLRADRDRLLLLAGEGARPSLAEGQQLVEAFNGLFGDDGLQLVQQDGHWFLRSDEAWPLDTQPTRRVSGRHLDAFLPAGEAGRRWLSFLNEAQMLFHGNPVNAERERQGRLPVNGLWVWGGGRLPARTQIAIDWVTANDPAVRGFASLAGLPAIAGVERLSQLDVRPGRGLVVWDEPERALVSGDATEWLHAVAAFESQWAIEALSALRNASLSELRLYPCDGRVFVLGRRDLHKLWRRPRSFQRWLARD